jgi:hypothetical protein
MLAICMVSSGACAKNWAARCTKTDKGPYEVAWHSDVADQGSIEAPWSLGKIFVIPEDKPSYFVVANKELGWGNSKLISKAELTNGREMILNLETDAIPLADRKGSFIEILSPSGEIIGGPDYCTVTRIW